MREANDETYELFPESLRVVAVTGAVPFQEGLAVSDHPDADMPGFDTFVRYIRSDESDLHGFVPDHWQNDALATRKMIEMRIGQFQADIAELKTALNSNARSTRDRLQRVRGIVERLDNTWSGRAVLFGKKDLDAAEDMI